MKTVKLLRHELTFHKEFPPNLKNKNQNSVSLQKASIRKIDSKNASSEEDSQRH